MEKVNADVIGAVTNVIYAINTLTSNGEYDTAYHLALAIQEVAPRCGISKDAIESVHNIVTMLADKVNNMSERRTLN